MPLISHHQLNPKVDGSVFLAEGAVLIGDVQVGAESSVWFHSVLRGDLNSIRIGKRTNIQDLCVGHVTSQCPLVIDDEVTVGHRVVIHGCHIRSRALIGMGSVVMDGAVIGEEAIVGAGALVTEKMVIPPRTLALGSPAKVKRELTPEEIGLLKVSADHYVDLAKSYKK